ncbi:MAG: hypothetical protein WBI96_03490 [Candidatus Hydrothermia bacterium]
MKKYFSRRFLVFVVATVLVALGRISDWVWFLTGITYISLNTIEKILSKGGKNA